MVYLKKNNHIFSIRSSSCYHIIATEKNIYICSAFIKICKNVENVVLLELGVLSYYLLGDYSLKTASFFCNIYILTLDWFPGWFRAGITPLKPIFASQGSGTQTLFQFHRDHTMSHFDSQAHWIMKLIYVLNYKINLWKSNPWLPERKES